MSNGSPFPPAFDPTALFSAMCSAFTPQNVAQTAIPSLPSIDIDLVKHKIQEMKSVEAWLAMNLDTLRQQISLSESQVAMFEGLSKIVENPTDPATATAAVNETFSSMQKIASSNIDMFNSSQKAFQAMLDGISSMQARAKKN